VTEKSLQSPSSGRIAQWAWNRSGFAFGAIAALTESLTSFILRQRPSSEAGKAAVDSVRAQSSGYRMQKDVWLSGGKTLLSSSPDNELAGSIAMQMSMQSARALSDSRIVASRLR
jgi:hypothetical protein